MQNVPEERWRELCELAAQEQDPEKLLRLTREIERIFAQEDESLKRHQPAVG